MKNLKLFIILTLITVSILFMFGCNKVEITNNPEDIYDKENTDSSGLLIKEKTYPYGENDVLLLSINNPTDKNLSITINVSYFDADKNLLKEDTRTYDQMHAGGSNNFIFNPEIDFDSYSYSLSTEEYNGTVIVKDVGLNFSSLSVMYFSSENGEVGEVISKAELSYNGSLPSVYIGTKFLIIDKNGELYGIFHTGTTIVYKGNSNYRSISILESETDNVSIPEELNGDISIIYDYTTVEKYGDDGNELKPLPDNFVMEEKEYKVGDITYSLIYIKNNTDTDYKLSYRTSTYENGNSLGGNDIFEFGNYSAGYENYLWLYKNIEKDDGTLFEYKYEFFVSNPKGKNINLHFDFDNVSKKTVQIPDGEKTVIGGTLTPKFDVTPQNTLIGVDVIGIDKSGKVCCTGNYGNIINDTKSAAIQLNYVDDTSVDTATEDIEYIVAISRVLPLE